jgi:hypothetical protein
MGTRTWAVCWIVIVAGCWTSPHTQIESARAPDMSGSLATLFVVTDVGINDEASAERFEAELRRGGAACGIRIGLSRVSKLDLDPEVHVQRQRTFGARHVLTVQMMEKVLQYRRGWGPPRSMWSSGKVVTAGVAYDAKLFGEGSNKLLWRADIHLTLGRPVREGDAATTLARDLLGALMADGIIRSCDSAPGVGVTAEAAGTEPGPSPAR